MLVLSKNRTPIPLNYDPAAWMYSQGLKFRRLYGMVVKWKKYLVVHEEVIASTFFIVSTKNNQRKNQSRLNHDTIHYS